MNIFAENPDVARNKYVLSEEELDSVEAEANTTRDVKRKAKNEK
jgi:hypothetical protein